MNYYERRRHKEALEAARNAVIEAAKDQRRAAMEVKKHGAMAQGDLYLAIEATYAAVARLNELEAAP